MSQTHAVLLAGHGSRRNESNQQVRDVADRLESRLGERVKPAFIELEDPLLHEGIDDLAAQADSITVVPLTLFAAGHVKNDIPLVTRHARDTYEGLSVQYGAHLGVQPELVDIVADRIDQAEAEMDVDRAQDDISVVFCARGSSDPDANAEAYRLARLVYEGRSFTRVEPTFIGITEPILDRTLEEVARHDPAGIIVVPYMLGDGVLTRRVNDWVDEFAAVHPHIETATTDVLGIDDRLVAALAHRVEEARDGAVSMPCDTCKYKVQLAGFEDEVGGDQAFVDALEHTLAHVQGGHQHDHGHGDGHEHDHGHGGGHAHDHGDGQDHETDHERGLGDSHEHGTDLEHGRGDSHGHEEADTSHGADAKQSHGHE